MSSTKKQVESDKNNRIGHSSATNETDWLMKILVAHPLKGAHVGHTTLQPVNNSPLPNAQEDAILSICALFGTSTPSHALRTYNAGRPNSVHDSVAPLIQFPRIQRTQQGRKHAEGGELRSASLATGNLHTILCHRHQCPVSHPKIQQLQK